MLRIFIQNHFNPPYGKHLHKACIHLRYGRIPYFGFFHFSENYLFTNPKTSAIIFLVKAMASWCSRLARQPVTLEVDGSSPFEVAKK